MNFLAVIVTVNDYWLTMIVSVFLPMVVALVTKQLASSTLKAIVLLFLSAVTGTVTSWQATGGVFEVKDAVVATIMSFVIAVGFHYGLLKKVNITGDEGAIQANTANFGVG